MEQGLEGRSNNPVSLLMDTLNHPCADLGLELPSLLEWHHHPECQVDHIVIGKGPPGGSWQVMLFMLLLKKVVNYKSYTGILSLKNYICITLPVKVIDMFMSSRKNPSFLTCVLIVNEH